MQVQRGKIHLINDEGKEKNKTRQHPAKTCAHRVLLRWSRSTQCDILLFMWRRGKMFKPFYACLAEMSEWNLPSGLIIVFVAAFLICLPPIVHLISAAGFEGADVHVSWTCSPTRDSVGPAIVKCVGATEKVFVINFPVNTTTSVYTYTGYLIPPLF